MKKQWGNIFPCIGNLLFVVLLLCPVVVGWARDPGSVAVADDYRAIGLNPAGVALNGASGLAIGVTAARPFEGEFTAADLGVDLSLGLSSTNFGSPDPLDTFAVANPNEFSTLNEVNFAVGGGYLFQYSGAGMLDSDRARMRHTFAFGIRPVDWLLLGTSYAFTDIGVPGTATLGMLVRPWPFISLGATVGLTDFTDFYTLWGIGFRPIALFDERVGHRLTLSVDSGYVAERILLPSVRLEAAIVEGITLESGYNFENNRWFVGLSVAAANVDSGINVEIQDNTSVPETGLFAHVNINPHRSILTDGLRTIIDYSPGPQIVDQRRIPQGSPLAWLDASDDILSILDQIAIMRDDPTVVALLFRNNVMRASYANWLELHSALLDFKSTGKQIVFYNQNYSQLQYALAAATADTIYIHPSGTVRIPGFASVRPYFRELLDNVGVGVEVVNSHPYKTAGNQFSEPGITDEERETFEALLGDFFDHFVELIESGRGEILTRPITDLIEERPYWDATMAMEVGLIDALLYDHDLDETLHNDFDADIHALSARRYVDTGWSHPPADTIALIRATGTIGNGAGIPGTIIGDTELRARLRHAANDDSIRGVLLRVDSPGGSAIASEDIAREVDLLAQKKPVVVSMGGSAASGGYYISAPADRIVAWPTSVTGSIGVIFTLPNIEGLSEKVGINWDVVKKGQWADSGSPARSVTDRERAFLEASIATTYDRFVSDVARYRNMSVEEVDAVAKGRVWSGARAKELGLVDEIGGLRVALGLLNEMIGSDTIRVVDLSPNAVVFDVDLLLNALSIDQSAFGLLDDIALLFGPETLALVRAAGRHKTPLTIAPYILSDELE